MDATLIFDEKFTVHTTEGREILIALDPIDATQRVLFDCHSPKGPHLHVDLEKEGTPFEWKSLLESQRLFCLKVIERFGEIPELRGVLK